MEYLTYFPSCAVPRPSSSCGHSVVKHQYETLLRNFERKLLLPFSIHVEGFTLFCKHQEKPIETQKIIKNQTCSKEENAVLRKVIFFFEQAPSTAATIVSLLTISGEQAFGIIATELLHIAVSACSNSSFPYSSKYFYPQCLLIYMFDINLL